MSERLTDEQLREMATPGMPPIGAIIAAEVLALRARVTQLEVALKKARGWVVPFDNAEGYRHPALELIDAALSETA